MGKMIVFRKNKRVTRMSSQTNLNCPPKSGTWWQGFVGRFPVDRTVNNEVLIKAMEQINVNIGGIKFEKNTLYFQDMLFGEVDYSGSKSLQDDVGSWLEIVKIGTHCKGFMLYLNRTDDAWNAIKNT